MKRFLSVFLAALIVITFSPSVFALDLGSDINADYILESDVEQDLSDLYIDGKRFSEVDYPLNAAADYVMLLSFLEYGYHSQTDKNLLYVVYLYNPSGAAVYDDGNKIRVAINDPNTSGGYTRYLMELLDASEDNRFLKFSFHLWRSDELNPSKREYNISGIELNTRRQGLTVHDIATKYTFTGSQYDGTLKTETDGFMTIQLDLRSTFYRINNSEAGKFYQSQLDSVYFALDNWIMDKYGEVYAIHFGYDEQLFNSLVTWSESASDLPNAVTYGLIDDLFPYQLRAVSYYGGEFSPYLRWGFTSGYANTDWIPFVMSGHYVDSATAVVPFEDRLAYASKYNMWDKASSLVLWAPKTRDVTLTVKDKLNLLNYDSNHNFVDKMLDYGFYEALWGDFDASQMVDVILKIRDKHFIGTNEEISDSVYVDVNDVTDLKDYFNNAEELDKSVYLFRFNTQNYYSIPMYFYTPDDDPPSYMAPNPLDWTDIEGHLFPDPNGYYCEETVYRDFVIIDMTFRDNLGRYTVLPVISDPIDVLGDATPPVDIEINFPKIFGGDGSGGSKILSYVMIALVVILALWLISKLVPKRVRVVNGSGRRRRRR